MSRDFVLRSSPETVHWGYFDAALRPVLSIRSGDTVTVETLNGGPHALPADRSVVLPDHAEILARLSPRLGPHILTGPIAVEGAEPGDALEIEILSVELRQAWGFTMVRAGEGALPDDFPTPSIWHSRIDVARKTATLAWGQTIGLRPFFGIMGVAPAADRGSRTSVVPAEFGGNIDCKELVAGTSLFLPVWVPGGLFSIGDGHAIQGDGEVCVSALETALRGALRVTLHKNRKLPFPTFASPTHIGAFGFHPDLDEAARIALRGLIALICGQSARTPEEAYVLCSLVADLRVTQVVDGDKGIHAVIERALIS